MSLRRAIALLWRTTFRKKQIEEEGTEIQRQTLWRRHDDVDDVKLIEDQYRLRVEAIRFAKCEHGELRSLCKICWPVAS